ncbi:Metallo-dependent phosphatase-like protein [Syncephalastrum racemosum]|uniref:Metallo-dependent phosphatase-like protein n=1 Tax=Syncephalastrum racemosum TaxID=13706 RepID=A0A1X2H594_SYNRA|nr:Metallo-dependent phosphatase-like protein [Syncephalastrum racemosum]
MLTDGKAFRIQFSTAAPLKRAVFQYWSVEDEATIQSTHDPEQSWAFDNGGPNKRMTHMHIFRTFTDLQENTRYHYRIGTSGENTEQKRNENDGEDDGSDDDEHIEHWSPVYDFHTPVVDPHPFKFILAADLGIMNAVSLKEITREAHSQEYDFWAYPGDFAYNMEDMDGAKGDQFLNLVQDAFARIPVLPAPGNHDGAFTFSHFLNRFRAVSYKESGAPSPSMYSFDYKSIHFVSITTEPLYETSPEDFGQVIAWLRKDLSRAHANRAERPWNVVQGHRPLYCTSIEPGTCGEETEKLRSAGLEQVLLDFKVDVYLCGHRHNYERTYPVANGNVTSTSYTSPPSYFQVLAGNAGNFERPDGFEGNATQPLAIAPWSAKRYAGYGLTTVSVSHDSMSFTHWQIEANGQRGPPVDEFVVTKRMSDVSA